MNLESEARAAGLGVCRLSVEAYIQALDRWAFCVRTEATVRRLEAQRRLDCLARSEQNCL